jgi:cyclic pyranopterin phosphate synthase
MVDISTKDETVREAVAEGRVIMLPETLSLILDQKVAKGDVFGVARVAGIMAAKKTADIIPLCHPLNLSSVNIAFEPDKLASSVTIRATVRTTGKTGVEMEALTAVTAAGLTIYDMCKAVDRAMTIIDIRLMKKSGGKSGTYERKSGA